MLFMTQITVDLVAGVAALILSAQVVVARNHDNVLYVPSVPNTRCDVACSYLVL
jgi:hypothetical protein